MPGKLKEPMVVTDCNGDPVCILPLGFYLEDDRWEAIWALYDERQQPLTRADLRALFPQEPTLQDSLT